MSAPSFILFLALVVSWPIFACSGDEVAAEGGNLMETARQDIQSEEVPAYLRQVLIYLLDKAAQTRVRDAETKVASAIVRVMRLKPSDPRFEDTVLALLEPPTEATEGLPVYAMRELKRYIELGTYEHSVRLFGLTSIAYAFSSLNPIESFYKRLIDLNLDHLENVMDPVNYHAGMQNLLGQITAARFP